MKNERLKLLISKFEQGSATESEERELKRYILSHNDAYPELSWLHDYFIATSEDENVISEDEIEQMIDHAIQTDSHNTRRISQRHLLWSAAAMILIFISLYLVFNNEAMRSPEIAQKETYEDPYLAYMETKKALYKISSKMNEHARPVKGLKRLDTGMETMNEFSKLDKYTEKVFKESKD